MDYRQLNERQQRRRRRDAHTTYQEISQRCCWCIIHTQRGGGSSKERPLGHNNTTRTRVTCRRRGLGGHVRAFFFCLALAGAALVGSRNTGVYASTPVPVSVFSRPLSHFQLVSLRRRPQSFAQQDLGHSEACEPVASARERAGRKRTL